LHTGRHFHAGFCLALPQAQSVEADGKVPALLQINPIGFEMLKLAGGSGLRHCHEQDMARDHCLSGWWRDQRRRRFCDDIRHLPADNFLELT